MSRGEGTQKRMDSKMSYEADEIGMGDTEANGFGLNFSMHEGDETWFGGQFEEGKEQDEEINGHLWSWGAGMSDQRDLGYKRI